MMFMPKEKAREMREKLITEHIGRYREMTQEVLEKYNKSDDENM